MRMIRAGSRGGQESVCERERETERERERETHPRHTLSDLLPPARPHLLNCLPLPKIKLPAGTKLSTSLWGTVHIQIITMANGFLKKGNEIHEIWMIATPG
jgi:hypothetical protein